MKQVTFSNLLAHSLADIASANGHVYREGAAQAWADVGAAYLGHVLCGLPVTELRKVQYNTRETYGAVILDCRWYDRLKESCLNNGKSSQVLLPGPDNSLNECTLSDDLFLEMLDFCREG